MSGMRLAVLSDDKGHTLSASKEWELNEPPREGSPIWIAELGKPVTISRASPESDAVIFLPLEEVKMLLESPGGKWVDYYDLKREEAAAGIKTKVGAA